MKVWRPVLVAALALSQANAFAPRTVFVAPQLAPGLSLQMSSTLETETENDETATVVAPAPAGPAVFENNGLFSWMQPYLNLFGFVPGNTLVGAVPIKTDGRNNNNIDQSHAAALRQQAAQALQNIGPEERARRDQVGNAMLAVSAVYVTWATLLADDGGTSGHVLRALAALPLFFAAGFKLSAQQGL